ncbi:STOREKEEPER protein-like [Aristolochia californica]|uniref:STOREKEEPER protein-like n=1 Tax=Aristolochia californica TaxID=171875 RepID=UPI0035DD685E
MAAKKKPYPPPPSESDSSSSGSEESSEDEAVESPPRPSQAKSPAKKATVSIFKPRPESRSHESSDSGSEGEGSEEEATPAAKPVKNSTPEPSGESAESASGSDSESDHKVAANSSGKDAGAKPDDSRKRVAPVSETAYEKPAKRVRALAPVLDKSKEDDEIVILTGLLDYIKKGSDPFTDTTGFFNFVEGSVNLHEGPQQLADTVRRLKKRYQGTVSNAKRGKVALPQVEKKKTVFELSKKIWSKGSEAQITIAEIASSDRKNNKKGQSSRKVLQFEPEPKIEKPEPKSTELVNGHLKNNLLFSCWKELQNDNKVGLELMKEGLELMEPSKVRMLEVRWKKIEIAKLDILQKRRDLLQEQMEMILDALKQQRN